MENAYLNSPISKTPLIRQNNHFLVTSFLRYIRSSESSACGGLTPWGEGVVWSHRGGKKVSFFSGKFHLILTLIYPTGNSLYISYKFIYWHPLTLHTWILAWKVIPSIIMLHLNCSQNIPLFHRTAHITIHTRELTLNSS